MGIQRPGLRSDHFAIPGRRRQLHRYSNIYTKGHSKKIIGDFFAQRKGQRDRVVIATKFFCNPFAGDPNGGGASRKAIVALCEESLRRLQTDYIDSSGRSQSQGAGCFSNLGRDRGPKDGTRA
jgi:hypothetical protein